MHHSGQTPDRTICLRAQGAIAHWESSRHATRRLEVYQLICFHSFRFHQGFKVIHLQDNLPSHCRVCRLGLRAMNSSWWPAAAAASTVGSLGIFTKKRSVQSFLKLFHPCVNCAYTSATSQSICALPKSSAVRSVTVYSVGLFSGCLSILLLLGRVTTTWSAVFDSAIVTLSISRSWVTLAYESSD